MKTIRGKVQHGDGRGKQLGVPTANINIHQPLQEGVYAACTKVQHQCYDAIAFIGPAPTFNRKKCWLEVHLFNFNKQIYDKWITVELKHFLRQNKKFGSPATLKKAMKRDIASAKKYFKTHPCSQE